jgi:hypothetical protein
VASGRSIEGDRTTGLEAEATTLQATMTSVVTTTISAATTYVSGERKSLRMTPT